jgi:formylglycine-generating enzyme
MADSGVDAASAVANDDAGTCSDAGEIDSGPMSEDGGADDGGVDAGPPSPCPDATMARIGRFCIDRWEAHLEVEGDGGFSPWEANQRPPTDVTYRAASAAGGYPQAYISRVEAKLACKNAGKRLCSMHEWRRVCGGKLGLHYPYGKKLDRAKCNIGKPHLLAQRFGSDARLWKYDENFNDPELDTLEGYLGKSGEYEGCRSEDDVFDLAGNLHEWVSDVVDQTFVDKMEDDKVDRHTQPWKLGNGVFVGGFFSTTDQHGPGCLFTTIAHEPTYHDYSIGFRCCATAVLPDEPKADKKRKKLR